MDMKVGRERPKGECAFKEPSNGPPDEERSNELWQARV